MCGILGYISKKSIDKQNFQEANIAIQHRGPDAEGFFIMLKIQWLLLIAV